MKIYYCKAENFEHYYEKALSCLTKKRREKTEHFHNKKDKLLSLMSGLMLKKLFEPNFEDNICYNENGKPFFEHGPCFSISHSENIAVVAVFENNVGVDIEIRKSVSDNIKKRCFNKEEKALAFLSTYDAIRIWEAKEAVLKLLGTGFSLSPKSFSVIPFEEEHTINDVKLNFICFNIENYPITIAYEGENTYLEISEFTPKDLIC